MSNDDHAAPDLQTGLDFTPEDLATNRAGTLSVRQRESLATRRPGLNTRSARLYLGIAVALAVVNLFINQTLLTVAGVFFMIAGLLGLLDYAYRRYEVHRDAQRGVVLAATGPLYHSRSLRRQATPTLIIGEQTFVIRPAVWEAVPEGASFTVYYTPTVRIIVSAEAASTPSN